MKMKSLDNRSQLLTDQVRQSALLTRQPMSSSAIPLSGAVSAFANTKASMASKSMLKLESTSAKRVPKAKKVRVEKIRHTQGGSEAFLNDYDDRPQDLRRHRTKPITINGGQVDGSKFYYDRRLPKIAKQVVFKPDVFMTREYQHNFLNGKASPALDLSRDSKTLINNTSGIAIDLQRDIDQSNDISRRVKQD